MLTKIALLNSATYKKAEIRLDATSIQLLGGNNTGKTSLVSSLLFLFVIDQNKMKFEKSHTIKESKEYYFPQQYKSYIFFEGFHKDYGYFYIMLMRNNKNKIEYYLNRQELKLDDYLKDEKLMSFDEVTHNPRCGIFERLRDNSSIASFVFQKKSNEIGFLHINKLIDENRFQSIYNHIFNLSLVDGKSLKTGILILRGHMSTEISFDLRSSETIVEFKKMSNDIKELESVEKDYLEFNKILSQKNATSHSLKTGIEEIISPINKIITENNDFLDSFESKIDIINQDISSNSIEKNELDSVLKSVIEERIKLNTNRENKEKELHKINSYEPKIILEQMLKNTEDMIRTNDNDIEKIEKISSDPNGVEKELRSLYKRLEPLKKIVEKNKTILDDITQDRDFLNALFSDSAKSLSVESLLKQGDIGDRSNVSIGSFLFDFSKLTEEPSRSREELQEEVDRLKTQLNELEESKKNISRLSELKARQEILKKERFDYESMINDYANLPKLKSDIAQLDDKISECDIKEKELNKQIEKYKKELDTLSKAKEQIVKDKSDIRSRQDKLYRIIEDIENIKNQYFLHTLEISDPSKPFETIEIEHNKIRTLAKKTSR